MVYTAAAEVGVGQTLIRTLIFVSMGDNVENSFNNTDLIVNATLKSNTMFIRGISQIRS